MKQNASIAHRVLAAAYALCVSPWSWFFYGILAGACLGAVGILVALRVVHHVAIPWSSLHWAIARSAVIVGIALICFGLSMSRMKKKARGG